MAKKSGSRSTPKPAPRPKATPGPARAIDTAMKRPLVPGRRPFKMTHEK